MAFMPFQMQARSRQSAPNYTPQLVQQTGSDILGAFLAMMQMKQSAADSAESRLLTEKQMNANKDIADKAQKFSERRFDEYEKKTLEMQEKLMKAGLTREESEILATTAARQKEALGGKFARAQEGLPARFDDAINLGMENYKDVREGFRSLGSQFKTKGLGIPEARTQLQRLAQGATSRILADPDPASQIAGLRALGLELERAKEWAPSDLEDTLNKTSNYLGELQANGLSPTTLMNQYGRQLSDLHAGTLDELLKGQERLAADYYENRDFSKTRIGYGALSPEPDLSFPGLTKRLPKRELNMGPLSFDPVQGLAQTAGPALNRLNQSVGETLGGQGRSFMNIVFGDDYWNPAVTPVTQTDPGTISNLKQLQQQDAAQHQALEAASMMRLQELIGLPLPGPASYGGQAFPGIQPNPLEQR